MNNIALRALPPKNQYVEIKRRAGASLARRQAWPNNWKNLSASEKAYIEKWKKYNIGSARGKAYMKGIQDRKHLLSALGTGLHANVMKQMKGKSNQMYELLPKTRNGTPQAISLLLNGGNRYKKSGGVRTAAAKGLGFFGPTHKSEKLDNKHEWMLKRWRAKVKAAPALEMDANARGLSNNRKTVRVVRNSGENVWRIKNKSLEKNYLVMSNSHNNSKPSFFFFAKDPSTRPPVHSFAFAPTPGPFVPLKN
jgi:hypothetical protein